MIIHTKGSFQKNLTMIQNINNIYFDVHLKNNTQNSAKKQERIFIVCITLLWKIYLLKYKNEG